MTRRHTHTPPTQSQHKTTKEMQERKTGEKVYYRTEDIDQTCTTNHMTDLSMLWKCLRPSPTHHVVCIPESRAPSAFGTLGLIKLKRQCEQPGFSSALMGKM